LNNDQDKHEYLYWEFHEMGKKQAVRMGKWKGVRLNVFENPDAPVELYNLEEDPSETTDVSGSFPDVVKRIEEIMNEAHKPDPNWPLTKKEG